MERGACGGWPAAPCAQRRSGGRRTRHGEGVRRGRRQLQVGVQAADLPWSSIAHRWEAGREPWWRADGGMQGESHGGAPTLGCRGRLVSTGRGGSRRGCAGPHARRRGAAGSAPVEEPGLRVREGAGASRGWSKGAASLLGTSMAEGRRWRGQGPSMSGGRDAIDRGKQSGSGGWPHDAVASGALRGVEGPFDGSGSGLEGVS